MAETDRDKSGQPEDIIELEDALIGLVVRFGARVVADKAQDLYRHTKEWREQQAQPAKSEQEIWSGVVRAQENRPRAGTSRQQSSYEDAKRLLGG